MSAGVQVCVNRWAMVYEQRESNGEDINSIRRLLNVLYNKAMNNL